MEEIHAQKLIPQNKKGSIKKDTSVEPFLIYKAHENVPDWEMNYYFQRFTLMMNNLPDKLRKKLPPTDSRLRPD